MKPKRANKDFFDKKHCRAILKQHQLTICNHVLIAIAKLSKSYDKEKKKLITPLRPQRQPKQSEMETMTGSRR